MIYYPKYFTLKEIFPPSMIAVLTPDQLWALMDVRILMAADMLREKFGPCYINYNGMTQRGFRDDMSVGARYSQHRYGRALDINFKDISVKEVREYILSHSGEFPDITAIELVDGWLHIDCRNCNRIMVFKP